MALTALQGYRALNLPGFLQLYPRKSLNEAGISTSCTTCRIDCGVAKLGWQLPIMCNGPLQGRVSLRSGWPVPLYSFRALHDQVLSKHNLYFIIHRTFPRASIFSLIESTSFPCVCKHQKMECKTLATIRHQLPKKHPLHTNLPPETYL